MGYIPPYNALYNKKLSSLIKDLLKYVKRSQILITSMQY